MMVTLIKLTENDKRLIIMLLLVFILAFVIIGYASLLVKKIMDKQGSKADEMLKNVVEAEYFEKEKQFIKFGVKKNIRQFFNEAKIPFFILLVAWFALLMYCLFSGNWSYNPWGRPEGFATLLYKFDVWPKTKFFGLTIVNGFPEVLIKPHFDWSCWFSYLFVPANIVGGIWFLIYTQAYIARSIRIYKIAHGIYRKKLVPEEPADKTTTEPTNT